MTFSRYVYIQVVFCVVLFTATRAVWAEPQPGFDLDYCCEQAATIVLGEFTADGEFEVKEFLFGGMPEIKMLPVPAKYAAALRTTLEVDKKARIEALVYLRNVQRHSGFVIFCARIHGSMRF